FADDSGVVGATLRRAVFAEKYIAAASSAVGQRDDGLAALFVESVRWNTNMLGHAVGPQLRKSSAPIGVFGRTAQRRQVRTNRVRRKVYVTGPSRIRTCNPGIMSPALCR